jgi:hypothetical protein
MTDGNIPAKLAQGVLVKDMGYQPHIGMKLNPLTVGCGNTSALLTAVLKSE